MMNSGFLKRTISGMILLLLLLVAGILGKWVLLIFTALVSLIGIFELFRAVGIYDNNADRKDNMLLYVALPLSLLYFIFLYILPQELAVIIFIVLSITVLMVLYVFTFPRFTFEQITYTFFGMFYVAFFLSFIYVTRETEAGRYLVWLIFISSWVCDTCAYLVGCSIGRHKLAPLLSPKKSVEGAIGGIAGAVIIAYLFGYFVEYRLYNGTDNSIAYMIICAVGSVISQTGDLAMSAVKRNRNIKDFGTIIPGHGGVLDRFDSVILVAPFIYLMGRIFVL